MSRPVVLANSWTHVVTTYSFVNGLRLYVNGSLSISSSSFSSQSSGTTNHIIVGSPRIGLPCGLSSEVNGQYSGAVDELRVFSRELSPTDVFILANPKT